jgi:hypothetical protein
MSANRAAGICRLGFTRYALSISVERPTFLLEMSQSPFMNKKGPDFLQFDSPWFFDPGTIRLPSPPEGLSVEEAARRSRAGQMAQPYILETEFERRLHLQPVFGAERDESGRTACARECVHTQDDGIHAVQTLSQTHCHAGPGRRFAREVLLSISTEDADHGGGLAPTLAATMRRRLDGCRRAACS